MTPGLHAIIDAAAVIADAQAALDISSSRPWCPLASLKSHLSSAVSPKYVFKGP
jgi:hypothetical protein